ncbi:hypothetical protein BH11BAC5_BH11BAC5_15300 [soil metagenome]
MRSWLAIAFVNSGSFFTFFVLTQKKITKKSQVGNEYLPLPTCSFAELLYIVVSTVVILLLASLQLKIHNGLTLFGPGKWIYKLTSLPNNNFFSLQNAGRFEPIKYITCRILATR